MTDVHSHILFGIDDGSSSILESLELISKMKKAGFDKIILTPHYIEGTEYSAENKEKLERYELLKKEIDRNNMGVSIYLGNEIFIHNDILKSLDNDLCFSLNNGKYLLVELPFYNQILELDDIIQANAEIQKAMALSRASNPREDGSDVYMPSAAPQDDAFWNQFDSSLVDINESYNKGHINIEDIVDY